MGANVDVEGGAVVLFVDADPGSLDDLESPPAGPRWSVEAVTNAESALMRLEAARYDAIVTEMGLPGIDGASLLALVKERHPDVLRVVATNPSSRAAMIRAIPVAQQAIPKPYAAADLAATLAARQAIERLSHREDLAEVVGAVKGIGSQPKTFSALNQLLLDDKAGMSAIAEVVERDPVIAARILQLVNSSLFNLNRKLADITQAVTFLGVGLLRDLVLTTEAFRPFDTARLLPELPVGLVQDHATASGAQARGVLPDREQAATACTAALLQDLGQMVLASARTDLYRPMVRESLATGRPIHELEVETFGFDHAEVGAHLIARWGLPHGLVHAIAGHHEPYDAMADATSEIPAALRQARRQAAATAPDPFDHTIDEEAKAS
jgi:HD-like signal output (HDOD) protein